MGNIYVRACLVACLVHLAIEYASRFVCAACLHIELRAGGYGLRVIELSLLPQGQEPWACAYKSGLEAARCRRSSMTPRGLSPTLWWETP